VLEQLAKDYNGKVNIVSMNVDVSPEIASNLGIMAIPALVFYTGGKEVARLAGPPKSKIVDEIKRVFGVPLEASR
jgi:thioredoxin-like negative regulator of GroEL